jgi:AcrR family transcriptional regulator
MLPLVQERRDQRIAAAMEVFKEKRFHATSVRDIGRSTKMTQGTIYNYVRSKDDVLYLVVDRLVPNTRRKRSGRWPRSPIVRGLGFPSGQR